VWQEQVSYSGISSSLCLGPGLLAVVVLAQPPLLRTHPLPLDLGLLVPGGLVLVHLGRWFGLGQVEVAVVVLLVVLVGHEVVLLAVVVAGLVCAALEEVGGVLVLERGVLGPVVVDGALCDAVVLEVFGFGDGVDVAEDGLLDVWVVEELLPEFGLVLGDEGGARLRGCPVVGLSHDEPAHHLRPAVVLVELLRVLHVLHVRDDGLGVEAVLLSGPELLLRELLALDLARLNLAQEG